MTTMASDKDLQVAEQLEVHHVQKQKVLERVVEWGNFAEVGALTEEQVGMIRDYDKQCGDDQTDLLEEQGHEYAMLMLAALGATSVPHITEYVLALTSQMLSCENCDGGGDQAQRDTRADLFHHLHRLKEQSGGNGVCPYSPFLRVLQRNTKLDQQQSSSSSGKDVDPMFAVIESSSILAMLFSAGTIRDDVIAGPMTTYVTWLLDTVHACRGTRQLAFVQQLKQVLRRPESHGILYSQRHGLAAFVDVIKRETQQTQLLYSYVFCLWLLSFDERCLKPFLEHDVCGVLLSTLQVVLREKVVRVTMATLANLLTLDGSLGGDGKSKSSSSGGKDSSSSSSNSSGGNTKKQSTLGHVGGVAPGAMAEAMIAAKGAVVAASLAQRKWKDRDIDADVKRVSECMTTQFLSLSSFEKYVVEIESGQLSWTPVHTDKFWRTHVGRFEDYGGPYALIQRLCALLNSEDPVTLEVACYDLGEFARFHPDGRRIITKFGGKTKLMARMTDTNENIAKQALLATQKCMVQNWESLNRGVAAATSSHN